jgi:hypothetical protein
MVLTPEHAEWLDVGQKLYQGIYSLSESEWDALIDRYHHLMRNIATQTAKKNS